MIDGFFERFFLENFLSSLFRISPPYKEAIFKKSKIRLI